MQSFGYPGLAVLVLLPSSARTLPHSYAGVAVTYNPYLYETFVRKSDEQPVFRAHNAYLYDRKILANIA
jgi:hypothetical protein